MVALCAIAFLLIFLPAATPPAHALEAEFGRVADCPSGYTNVGLTCYRGPDTIGNGGSTAADCPVGYVNTGLTCLRPADTKPNGGSTSADCPSGYTNTGLSCLRPAESIVVGAATVADCPVGYTNVLGVCTRGTLDISSPSSEANCPSGYRYTGLTCFKLASTIGRSCTHYSHILFVDVCTSYASCPSGYTQFAFTCTRGASTLGLGSMTCPSDRFFQIGRCYVKCASGFSNTGEFCHRPLSTLDASALSCPNGRFLSAGLCYVACPRSGFTNVGLTCFRGPDTLGESALTCPINTFYSLGRCYQPCPGVYVNTGVSCYLGPDTLGESAFICPAGRFLSLGRCYLPCPDGYVNTGVSCLRPADTLGPSSMSCHTDELLKGVRCYTNTSAALNGAKPRPFWIYGHNPNTVDDVNQALADGANALEPDILLKDKKLIVYHGFPDIYHADKNLPINDYFDKVHDIALANTALSLIAIDIKPSAAKAAFGKQIWQSVQDHLLRVGKADEVRLNVLYSVGSRDPDGAAFNEITSLLGPSEGVQVDGEDDPQAIVDFLSNKGFARIGYGDGTLGANLTGIGPNTLKAIEQYTYLRADGNEPRTAYGFAISEQEALKEYITTGVDAIITDDVAGLAKIVAGRTDIRLATRDDNPMKPLNQSYALKVHTGDIADGGTDSKVTFKLTGCLGEATAVIDTSRIGRMERDSTNYLAIPSKNLGRLKSITVSRDDAGSGPGWWLDDVQVSSFNYLTRQKYNGLPSYTASFKDWIPTDGKTVTLDAEACAFTVTGESIVRQQGARPSNARLATIRNNEVNSVVPKAKSVLGPGAAGITGLGALFVKADTGAVLTTVGATCTATANAHQVVIEVTDTDVTASGTATITVTPNDPPVLGVYPPTNVANAASVTIHPAGRVTDTGHVLVLSASAPGFTGTFSGNASTGAITVGNAGPTGDFPVTVVATDNCGASSTQTFTLTVGVIGPAKVAVGNGAASTDVAGIHVPLRLTASVSTARSVIIGDVAPITAGLTYRGALPIFVGDLAVNVPSITDLVFDAGTLASGAIGKFTVTGTYQDADGKVHTFSGLRIFKKP